MFLDEGVYVSYLKYTWRYGALATGVTEEILMYRWKARISQYTVVPHPRWVFSKIEVKLD